MKRFIISLCVVFLCGSTLFAQNEVVSKMEDEINNDNHLSKNKSTDVVAPSELKVLRNLMKTPIIQYQDLINIIVIHKQKFDELNSFATREQYCLKNHFIKNKQEKISTVTRGQVSYAIMKMYDFETGFMFWITNFDRYALKDLQSLRIVGGQYSESDSVSGSQVLGMFDASENEVTSKKNWGKAVLFDEQDVQ